MRQLLPRLLALASFLRRQPPVSTGLPLVYLTVDLIENTAQLVSSYGTGREYHEGVAYWAGVPTERAWVVTTVLAPEAVTTPGSYKTSVVANAKVVSKVSELHLQILAQIHGHPTEWVGHSPGDDKGAFMPYLGFYSLVVPHYARLGLLPLSKCGIQQYRDGRFVRLTSKEIEEQFVVVPTVVDLRELR